MKLFSFGKGFNYQILKSICQSKSKLIGSKIKAGSWAGLKEYEGKSEHAGKRE